MDAILAWLDHIAAQMLPADIYAKLDFLYSGTIICLGAGIILMLVAVAFMIFSLRRRKRQTEAL